MMIRRILPLLFGVLFWNSGSTLVPAQSVSWEFGAEETTPLAEHGGVQRGVPGPRPPTYPDFDPTNTAAKLDGDGSYFSIADPGSASLFDFTNGDALTVEAWVKVDELSNGANVYVIGKGRTGAANFGKDNQNWALRLHGKKGKACVGFLFASTPAGGKAGQDSHWHRWTTKDGFALKSGWHHIAVTYRFGEPESVRGWIDSKPLPGAWDMGGPTTAKPVVDDDAVWIGSSMGGSSGVSFRGSMDSIALHRTILDDKTLGNRFRRVGGPVVARPAPELMPDLGSLSPGRVQATFHEGMPALDRWLMDDETWPKETMRWEGTEFLLTRLPRRYDEWGIRKSWSPPVLVRLAADVSLPPGHHRLLMRTRGLSRVWVNGKVVARTGPLLGSPSGEEPITPPAKPPLPGLRPAGHRVQEASADVNVGPDGLCRVVLETLAGGRAFRVETGELCLAVQTPDGKSYSILQPKGAVAAPTSLTDAEVNAALARVNTSLDQFDDQVRRKAAASRDNFWRRRHEAARAWARSHPAPNVPVIAGTTAHPIDAFLSEKLERAKAAAAETSAEQAKRFHTEVLPILRNECFRCHGEKDRGSLRLNSRELALKAGGSGNPAIVPGKSAESELIARIREENEADRMPPTGKKLTPQQIAVLEQWINNGAVWPAPPLSPAQIRVVPLLDDAAFLRRVYLDTVGVPPTESEFREFIAMPGSLPEKRVSLVDRLLADERWADHWVSYWQDVLAENPTLINAALNTTGPFRWFLYESLRDDKALDRFVTELILLRGDAHDGGSAGFGLAAQNDAPMAAKGQIVASAFLGVELQCARCHDSPFHSTKQRDLYSLAAMFERKPVTVPKTSSVPAAFFEKKARASLIKVTLKPGEPVAPVWPFSAMTGIPDESSFKEFLDNPTDTRERLAALITAPQNTRFAKVVVNRIWRRLMGAGIVEPAHDWEGRTPSHPRLLDWLAHELITHDYSVKHVARLILTSQAYQREAVGQNLTAEADLRFFNAPDRRRMTAEQLVDSFFAAAGVPIEVEELTLDPDGRRPASNRQNFGAAKRAWMFVSLSNERDRPSLTLPYASAVVNVLQTFGWSGERQSPRTDRETAPNVLQPGVLANSPLTVWLTRASQGSPLAELAVNAKTPVEIVESVFIRYLSRMPSPEERATFASALNEGFGSRLMPTEEIRPPVPLERLPRVTWSNHLRSEATTIQQEWERRARLGPAPDARLRPDWREAYEDFVWSVVNLREFVWVP